jgi:hypothetical protein
LWNDSLRGFNGNDTCWCDDYVQNSSAFFSAILLKQF